jgi:hypothetical protein
MRHHWIIFLGGWRCGAGVVFGAIVSGTGAADGIGDDVITAGRSCRTSSWPIAHKISNMMTASNKPPCTAAKLNKSTAKIAASRIFVIGGVPE